MRESRPRCVEANPTSWQTGHPMWCLCAVLLGVDTADPAHPHLHAHARGMLKRRSPRAVWLRHPRLRKRHCFPCWDKKCDARGATGASSGRGSWLAGGRAGHKQHVASGDKAGRQSDFLFVQAQAAADGWMGRWMDGWMDGLARAASQSKYIHPYMRRYIHTYMSA